MTGLLVDATALRRRAALARDAGAPFAPLAASLAADLDQVIAGGVHVAARKARLTRAGGRCPMHGVEFAFDPFSPHRFRCEACGRDYEGDAHHEFWLYRYQLWLAERAVHAAALYAVLGRPDHAAFAARVLAEAADVYPRLPNRDNVLGPTRAFFSTYVESLWLLALCVALDLLETADAHDGALDLRALDLRTLGGRVRDRLVTPSRALIASYPEGRSNRQVWNAAARLAAARVLGDRAGTEQAVHGPDGVAAVLADGLLADGTWYEGDNYHQFAHRGLWFGVTMAERAGLALDPRLVARFDQGFAAPFLVAMPGLTLPARRDAQFGVSLRQWRWAEWLELGVARTADQNTRGVPAQLAAWLHTLYAPSPGLRSETGRWRASGEAERNEPAAALTRADLGWKALLFAGPTLPTLRGDARVRPPSVLLPEQGLAILRGRARDSYASLDYGPPGGGHGHPDRLNVQIPPFVLDPGTGSYVERTLHWYRSTLAHAAPLVAQRSQPPATGRLLAFDGPRGAPFQLAAAEAEVAPGVIVRRWLVLADDYLVDRVVWRGLGGRTLDLPLGGRVASASAGGAGASPWRPVERRGAGGLEDGFDFLTHAAERPLDAAGTRLVLGARGVDDTAPDTTTVAVHASAGALLWRAVAPGAPGHRPGEMCAVRVAGDAGAITAVWDLGGLGDVEWSAPGDALTVILRSGGTDRHHPPGRDDVAWRIRVERPGAPPNDVRLPAFEPSEPSAPSGASMRPRPARAATTRALDPAGAPLVFALGEAHYHRTEDDWAAAGRPTAHVTLRIRDDRLHVTAAVRLGRAPVFVPPGTDNPLDNERSGVNGDGLQLHLGLATADDGVEPMGAWLLVPVAPGEGVDVVPTAMPDPAAAAAAPAADWAATPGGWTLDAAVPLAPLRARAAEVGAAPVVALALLVNEMPAGRERRRGQLVLDGAEGGGGGAFIYLRGDRYDPARGLRLRLPPAP